MMDKLRDITFHDSIDIVHSKLALIDKETIGWRFAFEECDGAFDSPNPADERSDQQRDNAKMRNQKGKMMFAPWPTGKRRNGEVRPEQN